MTVDPDHRSRLLSALVIQPGQILSTREIIPVESWRESVRAFGSARWAHAMAVTRACVMVGPPFRRAHDVIPDAYAQTGLYENRGSLVEVAGAEREAVMDLDIVEIQLHLRSGVQDFLDLKSAVATTDKEVKSAITRMAQGIQQRVDGGGELTVRVNPQRFAPNITDLTLLLTRKWLAQRGQCALCGGRLHASTANKMLQPSADRIDSDNGAYDDANVHITHLACNLAKNQYSLEDFAEWLDVVRSQDEVPNEDAPVTE